MNSLKVFGLALATTCMAAVAANASAPVALVEDASAGITGVEPLDYVSAGQTITVGNGKSIVLSYLLNCRRETITGGTVTVGNNQSTVSGGQVKVEDVQCDRGALRLAQAQAGQSGAAGIRFSETNIPGVLPRPNVTVYSVTPVVRLRSPGQITFTRLDTNSAPLTVRANTQVIDLASGGVKLEAGGLYRVNVDGGAVVVKVADNARSTGGTVVDRLIPM